MASSEMNQSFSRLVEETRARLLAINNGDPGAFELTIKDCSRHIRIMNIGLKASRSVFQFKFYYCYRKKIAAGLSMTS